MINLVLTDVISNEEVLNQVSDGGESCKSAQDVRLSIQKIAKLKSSIILSSLPSYHRRNDIIFKSIDSGNNMIVIHSYYLISFMLLMIISTTTLFTLLCCDSEPS